MTTIAEMLEEWHSSTNGLPWAKVPAALAHMRARLIDEESIECGEELYRVPIDGAKLAKELADLVYVAYGTAREFGIPLDAVVEAVHESNMTKIEGGKVRYRDDGKVLKGPNYREPDIQKVLDESVS